MRFYEMLRDVLDIGVNFLKNKYSSEAYKIYDKLREKGLIINLKPFHYRGSLLKHLYIYDCKAYYSIEKARAQLGFEPKFKFDNGMTLVKQWLIHTSQVNKRFTVQPIDV